jgi:hypothetical protein
LVHAVVPNCGIVALPSVASERSNECCALAPSVPVYAIELPAAFSV